MTITLIPLVHITISFVRRVKTYSNSINGAFHFHITQPIKPGLILIDTFWWENTLLWIAEALNLNLSTFTD